MGFYNIQQGDAPYFKLLADTYSMSDNFHQSVNGGTGANHIMLGYADAIYFSDGKGKPADAAEQHRQSCQARHAGQRRFARSREIENPDPMPGTNNWYAQDGYGGGATSRRLAARDVSPNANYGGGSYVNCADDSPARRWRRSWIISTRCRAAFPRVASRTTTISSTTTTPAISATAPTPIPTRTPPTPCSRSRRAR